MQQKKKTIYDISKEAGVSPATVSRVLTGNAKVSEEKKQKINALIRKYDFQPNQLARGLTNNVSHVIGFLVPDIKNPYFSNIYYEFESIAVNKGYNVMLCNSQSDFDKESNLLKLFRQKQVDGIVFMGGRIDSCNLEKEYMEELKSLSRKIPLITTSNMKNSDIVQIYCDEQNATFDLIKELADKGCKTLGIIGGNSNVSVYMRRKSNIVKACEQFNIRILTNCIIEGGFNFQSGYDCCNKLIKQKIKPDAICCINDIVAVATLKYLAQNNIKVPEDILLTGFDGTFLSSVTHPSITTVKADYELMAREIYNLFNRIKDDKQYKLKTTIPMQLVKRESTNNKF